MQLSNSSDRHRRWRVGADIGGTFTDVVVVDDVGGGIGVAKVSTTPDAFADGVLAAIEDALRSQSVATDAVFLLSHATTVVTNAILEEKGARVALVTTRGFRDVLELRRSARPDLYDLFQDAPSVLVPRRYRTEVTERIDAQGEVVTPLAEEELAALVARLKAWEVEAVSVSLLFSFLNPHHEQVVGEYLRNNLPGLPVFLSSEVLPEIREFERTSTTSVCAYVAPILESYLESLAASVTERGLPAPYVMGSNGGLLEIRESLAVPAMVVESGPAAGVIAAAMVGEAIERPNLISFDMGGTTAKASLILNGRVETTPEYEVGGGANRNRWLNGTGHPIRVPVVDLAEVSAGGGSIAWVDPAGALRVGPTSAGAEPGPVCYGRGGLQPTVTDANLLLGRLDATSLLAGKLPVDFSRAQQQIKAQVGEPLGLTPMDAAAGIIDIVNNAMAEALRTVSVERGHDPREFSLIAFGGAGPLHAVALAEELEIAEVIIPPAPGAFSALGLVGTDVKRDYARTWYKPINSVAPDEVEQVFLQMETTAQAMLERAGIEPAQRVLRRSADCRYPRQAYELNVAMDDEHVLRSTLDALAVGYHDKHEQTYGHANRNEQVQLVTLRVTAIGKLGEIAISSLHEDGHSEKARRNVWFRGYGALECSIFDRPRLPPQALLRGPAIVESLDSTIVIPPGWVARVNAAGFLFIQRSDQ